MGRQEGFSLGMAHQFLKHCREGKYAIVISKDYVVIPRKKWEEIEEKINPNRGFINSPIIFEDEAANIPLEYFEKDFLKNAITNTPEEAK